MFERELQQQAEAAGLGEWAADLPALLARRFSSDKHGDYPKWARVLEQLPSASPSSVALDRDCIGIGQDGDIETGAQQQLEALLKQLHPWRKGPFDIFGVHIDSEWRSDWKWQRLADHIQPLHGRRVLDVGCGNGYFCWRMRGAGAAWVLGIDPTLVYVMQFLALQNYVRDPAVHVLPVGIDELPGACGAFDTVFSMGVFYHRRSPLDHLLELKGQLRAGGELVLETLVIEGDADTVLVPAGRYARMRNVWYIPSVAALQRWLARCGFRDVRCIDVTATSAREQRATEWMTFNSLADFLDPEDPARTIEGYPAPRRAVLLARA